MHTFYESVGLSRIRSARSSERLIRETIMNFDKRNIFRNEQNIVHAEFSRYYAPDLGVTVCGEFDESGSFHPEYKDMYYPVNYGYIEGIMAPDGEEQDAYILGVSEPVQKFTGRIIAVVHRADDVEEKWVVCPEGMTFTAEEIMEQIRFQEQYYQSEIIM